MFLNKCYFYCALTRQAEFPNYPKFCLSEIGSAPFISHNRGSTVVVLIPEFSNYLYVVFLHLNHVEVSETVKWPAYRFLHILLFLGAFAKLRKATVTFVTSVCLAVRMEQLGSYWTDFREI